MDNLKERAIRGGLARLIGQGVSVLLRVGTLAVLARLLSPSDFGIVAMVTVVTGVYHILLSAGLSVATIQTATITHQQMSKLFWINAAIGVILALMCVAVGPLLVLFYHEPRLLWVATAFAVGFLLTGIGVQHTALLERQLRYITLTSIELTAQLVSATVSILLALAGFGYWALVLAAIAYPAAGTSGVWLATRWLPGPPQRGAEIGSLLRFGGTVTLINLIIHFAYNTEKALLGRFWGAAALGIYGRAYQLINFSTSSINNAVTNVALSALSRLQQDPARHRQYFLKGYSLVMSLTMPLTFFCALYGDDIILVLLGPQWIEAIPVFRMLTPTVLIYGVIDPLAWLLLSSGLQLRSLHLAMVIAPLVISAVALGLPYGPTGVAFAYSAALSLWLVPHVFWCLHGTTVSPRDLVAAASRPFLAAVAAASVGLVLHQYLRGLEWPIVRLALGGTMMAAVYCGVLLFALGQRRMYFDLLQGLRTTQRSALDEAASGTHIAHAHPLEGARPEKIVTGTKGNAFRGDCK